LLQNRLLNAPAAVDWYLQRVQQAVEAANRAADGAPLTLLCHSAGGWLGRLFLLECDRTGVDQFVSLGSPQLAPPPGVVDQVTPSWLFSYHGLSDIMICFYPSACELLSPDAGCGVTVA
jgi:alpha-beta hydrolase superfamily lysophospholipase